MKIRLWKLGNLEKDIYPTQQACSRLAEILTNAKGDALDIIWGPDLTVETVEGDIDVIVTQLKDGNQRIQVVPQSDEENPNEDSS